MFLKTSKKSECSGCTACKCSCPKNAIEMIYDEEGFQYPFINKEKCIECGLCYNICPNIIKNEENTIIEAHGAKHKNEIERFTSRSGGVFVAISDYILELGGVIYGAELNDRFEVEHGRAIIKEQRDKFKGSKYIQSDMKNIILDIKKDLQNGKKVLFSGTPCQVAGVKAAIPKKYYDNLNTCDLICHGVPSKRVFRDFLRYIENKENKRIKRFIFRDKRFGWNSHFETFIFEDETQISTRIF